MYMKKKTTQKNIYNRDTDIYIYIYIRTWIYFSMYTYLPNPSTLAGYDTRSIFK